MTTLELLARFETRELTLTEWDHAAHLTVAHHYLTSLSEPSLVLLRLREGIQRLNLSHGIYTTPEGGYHETITRFWICKVLGVLNEIDREDLSLQRVLALGSRPWLAHHYYTKSRLRSWEARISWVPPDLEELSPDPGLWGARCPDLISFPPESTP